MDYHIYTILIAFIASMAIGFIAIPRIISFCQRKNLYDPPAARKVHSNNIPRLGGIAFMPSMIISFLLAIMVLNIQHSGQRIEINLWSLNFMASLVIIYAMGLLDDVVDLDPRVKFVVQICAASLLPMAGLYINNLYGLFGIYEIDFWVGAPLTVLAIVFIDNAMNLIDGIDGLCAGLAMLALIGFFCCFWQEKLYVYCLLIAGLAGALATYICFNVFGKPEKNTKIFMGDSGSLTLGFILGFLFVKYIMDNRAVMPFREDRMVMAYSLLIVPAFDVVRVVFYRLRHRRPIFGADKCHIHHKLMAAGQSMHQALVAILTLAVLFLLANGIIYPYMGLTWTFLIDVALYTAFHLLLNVRIAKKDSGL